MELISAGLDIGTTTTRVAVSRITISDTAPAFMVPDMRITQKSLVYRGKAQLTPKAGDAIDSRSLTAMIEAEYTQAGFNPEDIDTGAVIFTGEAARKKNAPETAEMLARLAGGFVVAAAGADMEGVLAAKGSGAAAMSAGRCILHTDIGGGTSNLCLLVEGEPCDTGCLDIGGRLIKYVHGSKQIEYISPSLQGLNWGIAVGDVLTLMQENVIADHMADILAQALYLKAQTDDYFKVLADHGIAKPPEGCALSFSGGVGELFYGETDADFDDIGPALARAMQRSPYFSGVLRPPETGSATVMGAADFSMSLSGSTVHGEAGEMPMKGIPAAAVRLSHREDIPFLAERLKKAKRRSEGLCAFAFKGFSGASFADIEAIAEMTVKALDGDIVLVVEADMAKALGQALARRTKARVLCLDGIRVSDGDFIDIGAPAGGAYPVIVHTLIFGR